jgi:aminoglycoside/choline kinase family phosphotransferase
MMEWRERIEQSLTVLPEKWRVDKLEFQLLHGDASYRRYVRIGGFSGGGTLVAMLMTPEQARFSEEAMAGPPPEELPFINIQRYLKRLGLPVPEIVGQDTERAVLFLEDLGDTTLARAIAECGPEQLRGYYRQAVELLVEMQLRCIRQPSPDCLAYRRAFAHDLLLWELHHFREYLLEAGRDIVLDGGERAELDRIFERLAGEIAAWPRLFVHRDFQSRNLMLTPRGYVLIDFQDALLGPQVYDLVALLRDSYVQLAPELVEELLDYYAGLCRSRGLECPPQLTEKFLLMSLQRKLKDAGRFVFIEKVKHNPSFLPFIPASLGYVRAALDRLPQLDNLRRLLARHLPELA